MEPVNEILRVLAYTQGHAKTGPVEGGPDRPGQSYPGDERSHPVRRHNNSTCRLGLQVSKD